MQGTFISFNTAGIKYEERFLALMLKTTSKDKLCRTYYLQTQALIDLLLILQNRMLNVLKRLATDGEEYKSQLIALNEELLKNIPEIALSELQEPNSERRIMSITLKPGETHSTLILVMQNEQIDSLHIDDMQVEALLVGIQKALINMGDTELFDYLGSTLDCIMLYALDLTNTQRIDYQQYTHEEWKLNLFSYYLGVLFCSDTAEGKKLVSGAVIKTSVPHLSQQESNMTLRLIEKSPKLQEVHAQIQPCQIFTQIIPSESGKMMTLDECLRPLQAFLPGEKKLKLAKKAMPLLK